MRHRSCLRREVVVEGEEEVVVVVVQLMIGPEGALGRTWVRP